MPDFDYTKPFRQKNGRAAKFRRIDITKNRYPLEVELENIFGRMAIDYFTLRGKCIIDRETQYDLINIDPQEEAMKLDFSRPFMDSQKRPARLICSDRKSNNGMTHLWLIASGDVEWSRCTNEHGVDDYCDQVIVNVPESQVVYLHMINNGSHTTIEPYNRKFERGEFTFTGERRLLARKKVTITEGEFDE